jgi:hypothetical protein
VLNINIKLDAEKVKKLLARAPEELERAINLGSAKLLSEMQRTAQTIVEQHTPYPAVAFGNLVRGIDFEVRTEPPLGGVLFVKPPADVYALPVETGTRPHFPPPSALLPWVKQKFPGVDEKKAKSLAFLVGRKISKVGTTGIFFFERTRAAHEPDAAAVYDEYLDQAIQRLDAEVQ